MKTRNGFVSNSSSCSFMITNKSDKAKTLRDFVDENPQLVVEFCDRYNWHDYSQEQMLDSAEAEGIIFQPNSSQLCVFGDEQGTIVGQVFDYILRDGGNSQNFTWQLEEYLR